MSRILSILMRKVEIIGVSSMLLVAFAASVALAQEFTGTLNEENAPRGTHFVTGTPTPTCTVSGTAVSCNSYELAGVGNKNATANLVASYSAIVDCNNPGNSPNNPIESHETTFSTSATSGQIEPKNGRLLVPALSVDAPADPVLTPEQEAALCPNPNWRAEIRAGSLELTSFAYTVTFEGFDAPAISISHIF